MHPRSGRSLRGGLLLALLTLASGCTGTADPGGIRLAKHVSSNSTYDSLRDVFELSKPIQIDKNVKETVAESQKRLYSSQDGEARFAFFEDNLMCLSIYSTRPDALLAEVSRELMPAASSEKLQISIAQDRGRGKSYVWICDARIFNRYLEMID